MEDEARLSEANAGFGLAAMIAIVFNTALACMKDVNPGLSTWMGSLLGHNWTTQGAFDLVLFFGLGFVFWKTGAARRVGANRLISIVPVTVAAAVLWLAVWYVAH